MNGRFIVSGDVRLPVEDVDGLPAVDVLRLGEALGYGRPDRLRRQVLENWTDILEGDHYLLAGVKKERMLLRLPGLEIILARSKKPRAAGILAALREQLRETPRLASPQAEVETADDLSLVERRFRYEATQICLRQLSELQDPLLMRVAVEGLEIALGRSRPDLHAWISRGEDPLRSPADPIGDGPLVSFVWYSLTQIGQAAGGYSAITAGKAADVVAARHGITREQLRHAQTPFTSKQMLPDNTSGKLRLQTRFSRDFANRVIRELKTNSIFKPDAPEQKLVPFGQASSLPKLSRGPLEDDPLHDEHQP
jgi:hypothetical protein